MADRRFFVIDMDRLTEDQQAALMHEWGEAGTDVYIDPTAPDWPFSLEEDFRDILTAA